LTVNEGDEEEEPFALVDEAGKVAVFGMVLLSPILRVELGSRARPRGERWRVREMFGRKIFIYTSCSVTRSKDKRGEKKSVESPLYFTKSSPKTIRHETQESGIEAKTQ